MSCTGLLISDQFLDHDTGGHHPERPDRLRALRQRLKESGLAARMKPVPFGPVERSLLEIVHASSYIHRFEATYISGKSVLDCPDCPVCAASFDTALLAAGAGVAAVDAIMAGELRNAFCCIRPPGHHAERARAMGFCFFNNIALAAERLRREHGLNRIAILDWDVHHGNGTQHYFEDSAEVLFCSIHQHPATLYPGTGFPDERGYGPGEGFTLNLAMEPGSGDDDYRRAFDEEILPAIDAFKPQFILISAGFDAHHADPLAGINLVESSFAWMTREMMTLAASHCQHRLASFLEGGYDLRALSDSVQAHLEILLDLQ